MTLLTLFHRDHSPGILTGGYASVKRRKGSMQIDIVSDVICPWCFIGKRRLERALALRPDLTATLSWRAFQLNPDMPIDGISRELYLSAKFGAARAAERLYTAVCAAGRVVGIEFSFERIRRTPNTLRAHRLVRLAALEGCADPVVEALFQAYFVKGLDIGDIDNLAAIATRAGLDETETSRYLAGEAGAKEVRAEERRARQLGIHAVPCFILDRGYAISGAQEPEMFLPLFDIAAGPAGQAAASES
jgi:predicted DsbA family dithiol-disulfide isomerase